MPLGTNVSSTTPRSTPQSTPATRSSTSGTTASGPSASNGAAASGPVDSVSLSPTARAEQSSRSPSESILSAWGVPRESLRPGDTFQLDLREREGSTLPRGLDPAIFGSSPRFTVTEDGLQFQGQTFRSQGTVRLNEDGSITTVGRAGQHDVSSVQRPAEGGGYTEDYRIEHYVGGHRDRPISTLTEGRVEADGSSEVTELRYRSDGSLFRVQEEAREGPGPNVDFHREEEVYNGRGELTAEGRHTRETGEDGVVRERETFDGPYRTVEGHRTILPDGTQTGERTEVRSVNTPETDIEGIGWFGSNNPQRVLRELGDPDNLQGFEIERTRYTNDGPVTTNSTLLRSQDGTRELERTTAANGGLIWDYRRVGEDGLVDSQRFFQGTSDTVITERSREGNLETTQVTATTPDLASRNPGVPSTESTTVRQGENVPIEEARGVFAEGPMAGLARTESYAQFFREAGEGGVTVATYDSTRQVEGQERVDRAFNLVDSQGRQLRGYWDPEGQTYATQLVGPDGTVLRASAVSGPPDNPVVTELDPQTLQSLRERNIGVDQVVDAAAPPRAVGVDPRTQVATASGAATHLVNIPGVESRIPRALAFAGLAAPGVGSATPGEWIGSRGNALAGALALTSAGHSFANGEYNAAINQLGNGLADVASLAPARNVPGHSPVYRQGFRALGAAGLAFQGYGVVDDALNGRELRAVAGAVGVGGTAVALFGSSSWAGPVGWGLAAAGTAGTLAWDYNDATRVAPLAESLQ